VGNAGIGEGQQGMIVRGEMTEAQALAHLVARLADADALLLELLVLETRAGADQYGSLHQRTTDLLRDVRRLVSEGGSAAQSR